MRVRLCALLITVTVPSTITDTMARPASTSTRLIPDCRLRTIVMVCLMLFPNPVLAAAEAVLAHLRIDLTDDRRVIVDFRDVRTAVDRDGGSAGAIRRDNRAAHLSHFIDDEI